MDISNKQDVTKGEVKMCAAAPLNVAYESSLTEASHTGGTSTYTSLIIATFAEKLEELKLIHLENV